MELGNDGITLDVYGNNDQFEGKLRIGKATVEWCKGRTQIGNGKQFKLQGLVDFLAAGGSASNVRLDPK